MNEDSSSSHSIKKRLLSLKKLFTSKHSKADLKQYLKEAQTDNILDTEEASMIAGVLSVSEKKVRDVMLPKSKMVTLSCDMSLSEAIESVLSSGHSRFPIERDDEVIGIILAKDLLGFFNRSNQSDWIASIMRPVDKVPESKPLNLLLKSFKHQRSHIMIVSNEYGEIAGLVTIEDVLEEIVGEIDDEYDTEDDKDIIKLSKKEYIVSATTDIEEFNQFFNSHFDDESSDTIGGVVLSKFGYIPKKGEMVQQDNFDFIIRKAGDRKICTLLVRVHD